MKDGCPMVCEPWTRREQIIRLLETLNDGLPTPTRRDHSSSGFVHRQVARESCPDCLANDRRMFGCETCGGRGYLEELRDRDPYATTDKVAPYGLDGSRIERQREVDRQIARLEAQTAGPRSEADLIASAPPEPWELERRRMFAAYDYRALELALETLRHYDDGLSAVLYSVFVHGWQSYPSASVEALLERGLSFIDWLMPDPIRSPGSESQPAVAKGRVARTAGRRVFADRDAQIREMVASKVPTVDVARTWGLSVSQVNRIIQRKEAA